LNTPQTATKSFNPLHLSLVPIVPYSEILIACFEVYVTAIRGHLPVLTGHSRPTNRGNESLITATLKNAARALEEGRPKEAVSILERILESREEDADILVCLGMAHLQSGDPVKAVEVLRKAEGLAEDHAVLALVMGRSLKAIGEFDAAEKYLWLAVQLNAEEPEAWADLCKVLYVKAKYAKACNQLRKAVFRFPHDTKLLGLYAMCLHRLGDYGGASEIWEKIERLQPRSIVAVSNHAYALLLQGKVNEAEHLVEKAQQIDPDNYRTQIVLGESRFRQGHDEEAATLFLNVLELEPDNAEALGRMAVVMQRSCDKDGCESYLKRLRSSLANDPESWRHFREVYKLLGRNRELIDCLTQGAKDDGGAAAVWVALATEYQAVGESQLAEDAWMASIRLRGYVKAHCPKCQYNFRVKYEENEPFDIHENLTCPACFEAVPMPEGLAVC
jgi:Flp pilus assembly protein TadD